MRKVLFSRPDYLSLRRQVYPGIERCYHAPSCCLNPIQFISTAPGLIITLSSRCFRARRKALVVNNRPRDAMLCGLRFTRVVPSNSVVEIFTRSDVAPIGGCAPQDIDLEHVVALVAVDQIALATCRRGDRSTKLSYTPDEVMLIT